MIQMCLNKTTPEEIRSGPRDIKELHLVSNLPFVSKILEKVVDARIDHHIVSNCLHEPLQSAYRKFH